MNVILFGMMGVGKTTVGKKIAELANLKWLDTDLLIEENYGKITEIFQRCGEGYFRDLEKKTVEELSSQNGLVLSVGGGLVLNETNNQLLRKNGKMVYLQAEVETLLERLCLDTTRPLLQSENLEERLKKLINERAPIYEKVADYTVNVDKKTPMEIAQEILLLIK